jgi:hypothetical protein
MAIHCYLTPRTRPANGRKWLEERAWFPDARRHSRSDESTEQCPLQKALLGDMPKSFQVDMDRITLVCRLQILGNPGELGIRSEGIGFGG